MEDFELIYGSSFDGTVLEDLANKGSHAVVAESSGVKTGRDEAAAERIHFYKRREFGNIAVVVSIMAFGEGRAGFGFDGNDARA